jgi:micrococcal nuclease
MRGRVVWVVDGDTIHVRIGKRLEKVRYIGVNAPEIPHDQRGWKEGGEQASLVNRALVAGRTARLELDTQVRDSYGRLLAYVWIRRSNKPLMVNAEMVREGYAQSMSIPPNLKYQDLFRTLQREAREAGRGLWSHP